MRTLPLINLSVLKLFKPEVFQGSLQKKRYFEGWYYKNVSASNEEVYAFIPGISISEKDSHAFIQIINGITGETAYVVYDINEFKWSRTRLFVKIGSSVFEHNGISLDIDHPDFSVKGQLKYSEVTPYPGTLISPGIMGWYSYMPFMECYHGVVSANHFIEGSLEINSSTVNFNGGKGYIEKDWGISFPECWIWLQSNSFSDKNTSLFVSVAKIPWLGKFFIGFIAFLYFQSKYYKFATYNRSKIIKINHQNKRLAIELVNSKYKLKIDAKYENAGELKAPIKGIMSRKIKESIDSKVKVQLQKKSGEILFEDDSSRAGLEIIEEIFQYFN